MKFYLALLVITLQCILNLDCYKFRDSDLIPERFLRRADQFQLDDLLYSSNRQKSFYDEPSHHMTANYQKALDAIAAEAALAAANDSQDQYNSEEIHLDDFMTNDDNDDEFDLKADPRDEETESHSSLIAGHQYVSGGAGEGKQHLQPDGTVDNKEEIKSDEDLPAYCDPPNPCPVGYLGDDCDRRPYFQFTAEYSKFYQEQQNCMCDDDHNDCQKSAKAKSTDKVSEIMSQMSNVDKKFSAIVAKKSPRIKRSIQSNVQAIKSKKNPYIHGEAIKIHVAKKSAPIK